MLKKIIAFAFNMSKHTREVERMSIIDYVFIIIIIILVLLPVLIFKF